jgi:alkaline phosphatase D
MLRTMTKRTTQQSPKRMPTRTGPTRRSILTAAACGATFAVSRHWARASRYPFTLGVASGEPAADGVVLWTRLAPVPLAPNGLGGMSAAVPVVWEVAADEDMRHIVQKGTIDAEPRWAHSVHIEVAGLEPGRPYWYRFTALGEQSPIGQTRTAPDPRQRLDRLRFAFASCSHWELGHFSAYRHMAAENPDIVLFLGDYIYEYTVPATYADRIVRPHDGPIATDLVGYRNRHALYKTDPDLQALHAAAACLVTWDDHEVENDYANQWSQETSVSPEDFVRRRAAAYQAYYEHMPLRRRALPVEQTMGLYHRVRFGDLATFMVLDARQYRSKQACELPNSRRGHVAPDTCTERVDPARTSLGWEQEQWLFDGFKRADTIWNLLAQNQLVAQLRQKSQAGVIGHWTDGWDGYPATRQRILEAMLQTRLRNPVFVGGDIHSFWTTDLKANFNDPSSVTVATEFVGTSITSEGPPYERFLEMLPENPHVRFFDSRHRGYVAVDLTRDQMQTRFQTISDRRDPNATLSTLKRFVVESGRAGAIDAS